ncbi:hypothetical protein ABKN59_004716 [Abortiporus biennis]
MIGARLSRNSKPLPFAWLLSRSGDWGYCGRTFRSPQSSFGILGSYGLPLDLSPTECIPVLYTLHYKPSSLYITHLTNLHI